MFRKARSLILIAIPSILLPTYIIPQDIQDGDFSATFLFVAMGIVGVWNFGRLGGFVDARLKLESASKHLSKGGSRLPHSNCSVCGKEIQSKAGVCPQCNKDIWGS